MFFENLILKSSSFDLFVIISLKKRIIIINEIIDKNERFFNNDVLLLLYLYRFEINNNLFFNILKTILYLFIYKFSKLNYIILIKKNNFFL